MQQNWRFTTVWRTQSNLQWQPTLTAHDPNPPITLEDPAPEQIDGRTVTTIITNRVEIRRGNARWNAILATPPAPAPDPLFVRRPATFVPPPETAYGRQSWRGWLTINPPEEPIPRDRAPFFSASQAEQPTRRAPWPLVLQQQVQDDTLLRRTNAAHFQPIPTQERARPPWLIVIDTAPFIAPLDQQRPKPQSFWPSSVWQPEPSHARWLLDLTPPPTAGQLDPPQLHGARQSFVDPAAAFVVPRRPWLLAMADQADFTWLRRRAWQFTEPAAPFAKRATDPRWQMALAPNLELVFMRRARHEILLPVLFQPTRRWSPALLAFTPDPLPLPLQRQPRSQWHIIPPRAFEVDFRHSYRITQLDLPLAPLPGAYPYRTRLFEVGPRLTIIDLDSQNMAAPLARYTIVELGGNELISLGTLKVTELPEN